MTNKLRSRILIKCRMALFLNWKNGGKIWGRSLYQWLLVATVQIQEEACILQLFIRLENSSKNNAYIHVWCISNHSISTVGYAKNQAVEQSSGVYLCFQDIVSFTKNMSLLWTIQNNMCTFICFDPIHYHWLSALFLYFEGWCDVTRPSV